MIKPKLISIFILMCGLFLSSCELEEDEFNCYNEMEAPGFREGTIFIEPDIITYEDASAFNGILYEGRFDRYLFDRRYDDDIRVLAYVFSVSFDDGLSCEFRLNPEFGSMDEAMSQAIRYATVIGQMPNCLRRDIRTVTIHKGDQLFGGGDGDILIHTEQAYWYDKEGILEESIFHEACHVSLDPYHYNAEYREAMCADKAFISEYAEEHPDREDIAESFLTYFAVAYRSDRISWKVRDIIEYVNDNRLSYFDRQRFDMYPAD
ncbi:hypothetical protein ACXR6G_00035 [Ancylomarina sp. YFZ004]